MSEFREIVTKAVIGKGRKFFEGTHIIETNKNNKNYRNKFY